MPFQVALRHVIHALSDALDLVGVNDLHHGKRVGIIAMHLGQHLGWPQDDIDRCFDAGLIHDIGVSSTDLHRRLVVDFDWEGSLGHAVFGAKLLGEFPGLAHLAPVVRHHHTHWDELQDGYGRDERHANLIYLADRVDVLAAVAMQDDALGDCVDTIVNKITKHRGRLFDPALVDAFVAAAGSEAFWLGLESDAVRDTMDEIGRTVAPLPADLETLRGVALLFSRVVDAKSHFTVEHSEAVARIARYLAERFGLDAETCGKLEIAGYLHDLGKLRIPDALLEKPGPLTEQERRIVAGHAYETFRILSRIDGFEDIARWAAHHHEEPSGHGYPFHLTGDELALESCLLRAADIFQALAQDRPYRASLPAAAVLTHLQELTAAGRFSPTILAVIEADLDILYALALSHSGRA
ncbi:HD domain-containing phosphohydrolase [Sulfurisoma sediminicola]|uniref:Putative nucleotidyltransferase with HDIG domain n=1 Tax=Sulfurisoma sediminicola TaxID=1381557 RepID=A0A497XJI8_9PROT|nr:HD domain-containing phosphohydrolase [Sulfurisoma sediminicola]RLJ68112.1 putative nucleotidyltransferase with HDIG domain [Sulfurisoma sediminicola]